MEMIADYKMSLFKFSEGEREVSHVDRDEKRCGSNFAPKLIPAGNNSNLRQ